MNKFFSFMVIFLLSLNLTGQLVLTPDTLNISFPQDTANYKIHMTVANNYNGPVNFWWRLVKTDFPPAWTTQVCDLNTCYFENVDKCPKHNPNIIAGGTSSDAMYINLNPKNTTGTTSMWFKLYSNADLTIIVDSLLINVISFTTSREEVSYDQITLFPNPATDHFSLKGDDNDVSSLEILDVNGKLLDRMIYGAGKQYSVSNLPSGLYFVRLMDRRDDQVKTLRLHKE
jgi:hypothetical protein